MMKEILTEWRNYLKEQEDKKNIRLPGHTCDITFKTGKLADLLADNKKIKRLRVPSWTLQTDVYLRLDPNDVASVAYCNGEPIAIVALTKDKYSRNKGLLNFFVDSWHRGMGLADKLFLNAMKHSGHWEYFVASRGGRRMPEKHGYEVDRNKGCSYMDCEVYKNKNYEL